MHFFVGNFGYTVFMDRAIGKPTSTSARSVVRAMAISDDA
jgi:hypothetical protein